MQNRFAIGLVAVTWGLAACGGAGSGATTSEGSSTTSGATDGSRGSPASSSASSASTSGSGKASGSASTSRGGSASAGNGSSSSAGTTSGGSGSASSTTSTSTTAGSTGSYVNPFGCKFGWGEPAPSGSLSSLSSSLQFVTSWAGYEITSSGSISSCGNCGGFVKQAAAANLVPAYYAYFIGYYGHANGFPDANTVATGAPSLATGVGALLLGAANAGCPSGQFCDQNKIVQAYAYYAQQTHAAWPTKPFLWLLEGDFVQYTDASQSQPLTMNQLGQLAALITTAIKTNMPNAVVAIDESNWNTDDVTNSFWASMAQANYDMVWTTGVANNDGYFVSGTTAKSYNGATAKYSYLHSLTGRKIYVDQWTPDTWSNASAATLDTLIASGVVALNSNSPAGGYPSAVSALEPQLSSTCP
jgi:hypothetical protein